LSPPADAGEGSLLGPDGRPLAPSGGRHASRPPEPAGPEGQQQHGHELEHEHGHEHEHERDMPEASLTVHVFHLASQVAMALGEVEHPISGTRETDLRAARFLIDVIAVLEEKTRGNRTPEEDEYVGGVLTNLRMAYVSKSR
jgi:hypothetical protein